MLRNIQTMWFHKVWCKPCLGPSVWHALGDWHLNFWEENLMQSYEMLCGVSFVPCWYVWPKKQQSNYYARAHDMTWLGISPQGERIQGVDLQRLSRCAQQTQIWHFLYDLDVEACEGNWQIEGLIKREKKNLMTILQEPNFLDFWVLIAPCVQRLQPREYPYDRMREKNTLSSRQRHWMMPCEGCERVGCLCSSRYNIRIEFPYSHWCSSSAPNPTQIPSNFESEDVQNSTPLGIHYFF